MKELDNLIDTLEKNKHIKRIKELNLKVLEDKELTKLIKEYQETNNSNIKEKIMSNNLFKEYKVEETEINLIIMNINTKLKKITGSKECNL